MPSPLTEFHLFRHLPAEVREDIWNLALAASPRRILTFRNQGDTQEASSVTLSRAFHNEMLNVDRENLIRYHIRNADVPALLHTTFESREIARRQYQLLFWHCRIGGPIFVSLRDDILHFQSLTGFARMINSLIFEDITSDNEPGSQYAIMRDNLKHVSLNIPLGKLGLQAAHCLSYFPELSKLYIRRSDHSLVRNNRQLYIGILQNNIRRVALKLPPATGGVVEIPQELLANLKGTYNAQFDWESIIWAQARTLDAQRASKGPSGRSDTNEGSINRIPRALPCLLLLIMLETFLGIALLAPRRYRWTQGDADF